MKGFVALPVIIILVIAGLIGIGWYTLSTHQQAKVEISPSPTPTVSSTPTPSPTLTPKPSPKPSSVTLVDCVGPDGRHFQATKINCDNFKKAWATPTPSPTATPAPASTSNSSSSGDCSIGQVSISISASNGPVVGDALISISVKSNGSCASSYSNQQILRQGSSSITFSGLLPATYSVTAGYHGNNFTDSFDMSSGGNVSKTVTVSN